ncbi:hypothetical protein BB559_003217 [Furculomyces boomerangus]|uniref:Pre-mRNA processing factor 4 (PRP4)-like domain-containing protein n=1 Tax=Furculomyces boomerangus TaxID=61424 RepID=A0A2T9YMW5_9FUNG|nr:hypothetical protein BB559_003217 [Furculomyces boomerangus]
MADGKRIHFGSLEHSLTASIPEETIQDRDDEKLVDLQDLDEGSDIEMIENHQDSLESHSALMKEFERKEIARNLAVPTDDNKVKLRLRELGEPICLFGERPENRRDRLRYLMSKLEANREETGISTFQSSSFANEELGQKEDARELEEFYTEGSRELFEARKNIAIYSIPRYENFEAGVVAKRGNGNSSYSFEKPAQRSSQKITGHNDKVSGICFHPQSTINLDPKAVNIATGGSDNQICLWSLESSTPIGTLDGHLARVSQVDFHPSGNYLASASYDGSWRLWDIETRTELLLQEGHAREVYGIKFQCDGSLVASAGLDAVGRVWDLRSGRSMMTLQGHIREIYSIDWSPNGYQIITGSADNTAKIYDLRMLKQLYTIPAHNSLVSEVQYISQDTFISIGNNMNTEHKELKSTTAGTGILTSSFDGSIKLWTNNDYQLVNTIRAHEGKVMGADMSKDGNFIASCGSDHTYKLYTKSVL